MWCVIAARAVASLHHHVHGRQHASSALQSDVWNRFVAGRATCSVDDQVGDAMCGQEVGWVIRWCGAEEPCLPVCRRQVEPHAQIPRCVDGTWDGTVKSDRSVVVLHHQASAVLTAKGRWENKNRWNRWQMHATSCYSNANDSSHRTSSLNYGMIYLLSDAILSTIT